MKSFLIKLHWILQAQFGLDLLRFFRALCALPLYLRELLLFRKAFNGKINIKPCFHDRNMQGGLVNNEYFWQDLFVARLVYAANPQKHVDIGSRVDGFVAHVASFRNCEVIDVRPITSVIPGVIFRQADLMNQNSLPNDIAEEGNGYCDSLSCLHAIEHFGLGRYNDPINPFGFQLGIANMAKLLKPGGTIYLSTPIGKERVEFNANWVFDPRSIVRQAEASDLILSKLIVITTNGPKEFDIGTKSFIALASENYNLGLFLFTKKEVVKNY